MISEHWIDDTYWIIMVNKLWVYLACIYISSPTPTSPLSAALSLSMILFVSQRLANFALGCNFGSQENAPRLHNLVCGGLRLYYSSSQRKAMRSQPPEWCSANQVSANSKAIQMQWAPSTDQCTRKTRQRAIKKKKQGNNDNPEHVLRVKWRGTVTKQVYRFSWRVHWNW